MDTSAAVTVMREALMVALLVPAPILLGGLAVGILVSVFQAATQIHEMTLVFIPKIFVAALIMYIFGHWMLGILTVYAHRLFSSIPMMVQ